jgi:hypothetical protein
MGEPISNGVVFGTATGLVVIWVAFWQILKFLAKGKK